MEKSLGFLAFCYDCMRCHNPFQLGFGILPMKFYFLGLFQMQSISMFWFMIFSLITDILKMLAVCWTELHLKNVECDGNVGGIKN